MFGSTNGLLLAAIAGLMAASAVGCANQTPPAATTESDSGSVAVEIPEGMSGVAELSEAAQSAAIKQRTCPVSGELLGSMGKPIQVTVEGQDLFVCCDSCIETVKEDPAKYIAKLKQE